MCAELEPYQTHQYYNYQNALPIFFCQIIDNNYFTILEWEQKFEKKNRKAFW